MTFEIVHVLGGLITTFNESNAPNWLCRGGRKGSTMCNRWFWENHVLTLGIDESVKTDFKIITRIS